MNNNPRFVYFGGEPLSVPVLEELKVAGMLPSLIVCNPDRPAGRKHVLTPPPIKVWALENGIEVWQPDNFKNKDEAFSNLGVRPLNAKSSSSPASNEWDVFVVVAYNKILPKWLLEIPEHDTVNVHPSLLPLLRGASPIRSAILHDMREEIGVSVMQLDEQMDHGPILAQMRMHIAEENWPIRGTELDVALAQMGGSLLAATLPDYLAGNIDPQEQDHNAATYCGRLERAMGELHIDPHNLPVGDEAYQVLLKIRAFDEYPGTFFMHEGKRVKIKDAELTPSGELRILGITPEGRKETDFEQYLGAKFR